MVGRFISRGFPALLEYSINNMADILARIGRNQPQPDINIPPQKAAMMPQ
jgi:hypothetical protein